jgi:hypothetical protein
MEAALAKGRTNVRNNLSSEGSQQFCFQHRLLLENKNVDNNTFFLTGDAE